MQEGGEVDPPLLDSQSAGTSSGFTLLPQTPNLESDIPEQTDPEGFEFETTKYLWENLDPSFGYDNYITDRYSSDNDILNEVPPLLPTAEGLDEWMTENAPEEIAPPDQLSEVEQMSPFLVNIYNSNVEAYKNNLNARNEAVNNFNESVVNPYNDWVEDYDSARQRVMRQDLQGRKALEDIRRKSTPESYNEMINNPTFGVLDLGLLKLREKSGVSFKNPDGILMTRGDVLLSDLYEGSADELIAILDEEAASFREQGLTEIDGQIEQQREEVENKKPKGGKPYFGAQAKLKALEKQKEEYLADESRGRDIAARKYFENHVLENLAMSEDEWINETLVSKGVAPGSGVSTEELGFGTYKEYIQNLEAKIYGDLLYNKEAYDFSEDLGMDGFKLILDDDVAVGDRNSRWTDAALSWRQGVVQLEGMIDATNTAFQEVEELSLVDQQALLDSDASWWNRLASSAYAIASPSSPSLKAIDQAVGAVRYFTGEESEETESLRNALAERDEERNQKMSELQQQSTQYAVNAKQLDLFGSDAILNENIQVENLSAMYNQAKRDVVFNEEIQPAIASSPTSLAVMSVAVATAPFTGGNSFVAAGASGLTMGTLVMNRTYYDSFTNPIYYEKNDDGSTNWDAPKISEVERHGMSFLHGTAEGLGEGVGTYVTFGIGKFALTPGRFSPYSMFKGAPSLTGATQYSAGRKALDYGFGMATSMGIGAGEEFIAEGVTGVSQMAIDSYFSGEKYTRAQYAERFMKDGKIGAWAGLGMGGGAYTIGSGKALYEKYYAPEVFNSRVVDAYDNQLTSSGFFFDGVSKVKLKNLTKQLDIIRRGNAAGTNLKDLTTEQKEAIDKATELSEELNTAQVRDQTLLKALRENGRGDLVAELVAMDNRLLFLKSMLAEYSQNEDGQWMDADGNLTDDPTKMELYQMSLELTDTKKKEMGAEMTSILLEVEKIRDAAENNAVHSPDYTPKDRAKGVGNWRDNADPNQYNEVSFNEETSEVVGDVPNEFSDIINRYAEAAKGTAKIIVHKTEKSFRLVSGSDSSDLAQYREANPEERKNKYVDEIHVYAGEKQTKQGLEKNLIHEYGHVALRDIVADTEARERLVSEILKIDNAKVQSMVEDVRQTYLDYEKDALETEVIVNFMDQVATLELSQSDITQGFEGWGLDIMRQAGKLGLTSNEAVLRDKDSVVKLASKFTNFVRQNGGITGIRTPKQAEALRTQRQAETAIEQADSSDAAGMAAREFNYLKNTKIYYKEVTSREGRDGITRVTSVREKTADLSDYNHFRNLYAKMTGNGAAPSRMEDIYFVKDGRRFDVKPPRPKTDRRGNILQMEVPRRMTYNERKLARAQETQEYTDMLAQERADLMTEVGDLWKNNDKNISSYTNLSDFSPTVRGMFDVGPRSRTIEQINSDIEDQVISKQNIQALIDSEITEDDLKALAGRFTKIGRKSNPSIFNMSGLRKEETHEQKADRLTNDMEGKGSLWQLLPKDSPSYQKRIPDLRLATPAELQYASDRFDRIEDEPLDGDLLDIDASEPTGLAARSINYDKRKAIFKGVTAENFNDFVNGKIKSGRIQSFEDLKNLMREANMLDSTGKLQMTIHNVDRTMVGPGSLPVHGDVFNFHLSGGPLGNSVGAMQGANVGHNTTTRQSSINITTYADVAKKTNKTYLLGLRLLTEKNSLGNPQVFKLAVNYTLEYLKNEKTPESTQDYLVESLNRFFNNKSYVAGSRSTKKGSEQKVSLLGKKFQPFGGVDGVTMQTGSMHINSRQGLFNFLEEISNASINEITSNVSFEDRTALSTRLFRTKVGLGAQPGFVNQEQFLDAVNQSEYKGVEAGSVVNATLMDVNNTNLHGIKGVSGHLQGVGADALAESTSYDFGVTGHTTTFHFEKPLSNEATNKMAARQQTSGEYLASRRLPGRVYAEGNSTWEKSTPTAYGAQMQRLAIKLQDRFSDVLLLQQDVEEFRGSKVPESQDFEMAMDLMYGKVRTDLEALEGRLELINFAMEEAGLTAEDVSDYLYAKHAEERNKKIEKTRPEMKSGSGITTDEAAEIIEELENRQMVAISELIYEVIGNTRKTLAESGLETSERVEAWENMYENYVPLSGLAVDEVQDDHNSYPTGGAGMAIYGKTTKAAKGRASKTGINLIANVIMQNAMVNQRARKNQAMMSLYNQVKSNPNEEVWNIFSVKTPMKKTDEKGNIVDMNAFEMKADRRMVPIRVNGEQHFIFFKKSDYADALNGMTEEKLNTILRTLSGPMTLMRNAFTQYNPSFFVGNFFRDIHGAAFNALAEIEREGGILQGYDINSKDFTKSMIKNSFVVLGHLLKDSAFSREMSPQMSEYVAEWEAAGGRTGFSYSESINNVIDNLKSQAETPGKMKAARQYAFSKPGQFFQYVAGVNEAFENSIRLAAYIEARKAGVTKNRAAQLSKNITINFNKSGELGPSLNQVFLFFNAAVQGVTRFGRTFQSLKAELPNSPSETTSWKNRVSSAQKLGAGMVLLSGLQTLLNMALSGRDEEDGELFYNKIKEYEKERGFIIIYGSGRNDYISIPLGYGYNMFNVVGSMLAEVSAGAREFDDALMNMALASHSAFSPIAMGNSSTIGGAAVKSITPTVLKAPLDAFGFNETYHGGKVYQEQYPFGAETPASTLSFRSPDLVQELFVGLHEMTGGTENIDGTIEINPDPYYYILQSYWGGAGDFVMDIASLTRSGYATAKRKYDILSKARTDEDFVDALFKTPQEDRPIIKFNDVPVIKTIYGTAASRFYDFDLYEENVNEILQYDKELRKGTIESRQDVNFIGIQQLKIEHAKAEDALSTVRKAKKEARDIEDYIDRSNKAYELQEVERKLIMIFNARYYDLRGQYLDPKPQGFIPIDNIRQILGTDE